MAMHHEPQSQSRPLIVDHVDFISVFDRFDEGVLIVDPQGTILYYNATMAKIDDLDPLLVIGKLATEVYDLTDETSMVMRCLHSRQPIISETFFYRTRMGKVANTIHSVFPLFDGDLLLGAICFVRDYNILEETLASINPPRRRVVHSSSARFTFRDIVGQDQELQRCVTAAQMAADSPSPVMLYGETGTGKELFAQSIHTYSTRRGERYTPINCAAIPENLLEGILFGTIKGAFTGALNKPGLFERTQGGTLFLDEINSMPVGLQAKILRVIQEKKVRRLGSLREMDIDVKIISSVNREPHRDIEAGTLRSDLFYRLGVVFIRIPPLRERRADLIPLVDHFLAKISAALNIRPRAVGRRVMRRFDAYDWPGNVRELEHILEGALNIMGSAKTIGLGHLPAHFRALGDKGTKSKALEDATGIRAIPRATAHDAAFASPEEPVFPRPPAGAEEFKPLPHTWNAIEKEMVIKALTQTRGHVTHAAETLGISRQLLHYKLKKYGLNRKAFIPPPGKLL